MLLARVIVGLLLLPLLFAGSPLRAAEGLPPQILTEIENAAERGRQDKAAYGNRLDERRRANNRRLEIGRAHV